MHLIGIEDQTFDFRVDPVKVNVFCNGLGIATIEHQLDPQGQHGWRFWYAGRVHVIDGTYDQALTALKRMHVEAKLLESAIEAIGKYVADSSAKLFGEEA